MPKVNEQVSQLAGKIAEKIYSLDLSGKPFNPHERVACYRVFVSRDEAENIISSALAEREQKVGRLVEAAKVMVSPVKNSSDCDYVDRAITNLRAALQEME